jgi:hypothetical protein
MRQYLFSIKPHHVGRGYKNDNLDEIGAQATIVFQAQGEILRAHIGKHVYRNKGFIQVVSPDQRGRLKLKHGEK